MRKYNDSVSVRVYSMTQNHCKKKGVRASIGIRIYTIIVGGVRVEFSERTLPLYVVVA